METIRWIGRLLIWPFIVLLDLSEGESGEYYLGVATPVCSLGFASLGLASVAAFVPLWPFPSSFANMLVFWTCTVFYLVVGIIFYFQNHLIKNLLVWWEFENLQN